MLLAFLLRLPGLLLSRALERLGIISPQPEAEPYAGPGPEPFPVPDRNGFRAPEDEPEPSRNGPPPPTVSETLARSVEREAAAPPPPAPEPPVELRPTHVDREAVVVDSSGPAEDVGAAFHIDEPWEGYAAMPAPAVVARLRDADEATRAIVRLYEGANKKRATVLRATG